MTSGCGCSIPETPRLHLERARNREVSSETAWCAGYWRGECPGRGWWGRELKEANKPPNQPKYIKNGAKNGWFPTLFDLKIAENKVFYSKVPYKIYSTPKMFFERHMRLKIFRYLRRCGVTPCSKFESHISPQPSGLGL